MLIILQHLCFVYILLHMASSVFISLSFLLSRYIRLLRQFFLFLVSSLLVEHMPDMHRILEGEEAIVLVHRESKWISE